MIVTSKPTLTYLAASLAIFLCLPAAATTSREARPVYCEADDVIDAEQVPYFVDILLDPEVTFEEVCYSGKMLATGPIKVVSEGLLPLLEFYFMEQDVCLVGNTAPENFSLCPYPWPSATAALNVLRTLLESNTGLLSANLALELLRDNVYRALFPLLLQYVGGDWNDRSESLVLSLLEDDTVEIDIRTSAASALLRVNAWLYYDRVLNACEEASEPFKSSLAEDLLYFSRSNGLGPDTHLIRLALDAIEKKYHSAAVDLRTTYSLVNSLRSYLRIDRAAARQQASFNGDAASINLRIRHETEEVIARTREYLIECESSYLTDNGVTDYPL